MGCCAVCKQVGFRSRQQYLVWKAIDASNLYQSGFVSNGTVHNTRLEAPDAFFSETRTWDEVFEGREMKLLDGEGVSESFCLCFSRGGKGMVCFSNTLPLVSVKGQLLPRRIIFVLASAYYAKGSDNDLRIDKCGFMVGVVDCLLMALAKCKMGVINGRDLFFGSAHYAICKHRTVSWEP